MNPAYPLIFLHLPKSAGTTFNGILQRQFPARWSYVIRSDDLPARIAEFKALAQEQRHSLRLLRGHQWFGLHEYLAPGARYLTMLREPVERVISHFHYVKSTRHPKFIGAIESDNLSLHDYALQDMSGETENGQTRWIAGISDNRRLDNSDLERAVENLETLFDWVGLAERFDESLADLALHYHWLRVDYRNRNVSERNRQKALPRSTLEAISERNQLDQKLYEYAVRRMDGLAAWRRALRRASAATLRIANQVRDALPRR